jgi:hypothetical protein
VRVAVVLHRLETPALVLLLLLLIWLSTCGRSSSPPPPVPLPSWINRAFPSRACFSLMRLSSKRVGFWLSEAAVGEFF